MRTFIHRIFMAAALLCGGPAAAVDIVERPDLGKHFEAAGVSGTFVMHDVSADRMFVFNRARAERRFVPASTFKIFNSLVAFETGAVKDENEILPYGGKTQRFKAWEQDMHMRDAMRVSNVPVYQEVARRVGLQRMNHYIKLAGYGNADIGDVVDRFWLDGPLRISAVEQASFMGRLAQRKLPFGTRSMEIVRGIIKQEEKPEHALFAKTGWDFDNGIGWWVGWVERDGKIYAFATNIDLRRDEDSGKRQVVTKNCLKALKVL